MSPSLRRFTLSRDTLPRILCTASSLLTLAIFFWITLSIAVQGLPLLTLRFLRTAPQDAGRSGGIFPILISTLWILAIALAVAVPIALFAAIDLAELSSPSSRLARAVERSLDLLAGVPSIVFGLFGSVFFCTFLHLGFSILSGGLTLAVMLLPILIVTLESGLRSIPPQLRMQAHALSLPPQSVIWRLLLPTALGSLVSGLVLGIGRALSETAALLFTSGYVMRLPSSPLDSGRALSIHIYDLSINVPGGQGAAAGSALVLLFLIFAATELAFSLSQKRFHVA